MSFTFTPKGKNIKVEKQIRNAPKNTYRAIRSGLLKIREDWVGEAKRLIIDPPKTGLFYLVRIRGKDVTHRASAPGQSPANMTGALKDSIGAEVVGNQLTLGAGSADVFYAKRLELGEGILARPYLGRAIDNQAKDTNTLFDFYLERRLTKL